MLTVNQLVGFGVGGGESDPHWDNVVLLMHMDGTDGSTTFVEQRGKVVTVYGNTHIEVDQSKFGGASAQFDGTGDYLTIPDSTDLDLGAVDFTIEFWIRYPNGIYGTRIPLNKSAASNYDPHYFTLLGSTLSLYSSSTGASWNIASNKTIGTVSADAWHHIALVKYDANLTAYIDGVGTLITASCPDLMNSSWPLAIGANASGTFPFTGFIDELRITKGVARYIANFTPPTMAFPDE